MSVTSFVELVGYGHDITEKIRTGEVKYETMLDQCILANIFFPSVSTVVSVNKPFQILAFLQFIENPIGINCIWNGYDWTCKVIIWIQLYTYNLPLA